MITDGQTTGSLSTQTTAQLASVKLKVDFTITDNQAYDASGTNIDHTDGTGAVKYLKDGVPLEVTTQNGYTQAAVDAIHKIGKFTIGVDWNDSVTSLDEKKAAGHDGVNGYKDYTFTIEGLGNVIVLNDSNSAADTNKGTNNKLNIVVRVTESTGGIAVQSVASVAGAIGYYAIRTNNPYGPEVDTSSPAKAGTTEGTPAYENSKGYYYVAGSTNDWVETPLHSADKLTIAAVN